MATRRNNAADRPITDRDLALLLREGPAAVEYYERFGMNEVRHRALNMAASGTVSLLGTFFLGWSPVAMLVFMVVDAVIVVLSDILRFFIAHRWIVASHEMDHRAGQLLLITDGLEDGTARRTDQGEHAPRPGLILFFGIAATIFLVPILGAATDHVGVKALAAVAQEPSFPWFVGASAVLRIGGSLIGSIRARFTKPGEHLIFMESGGVAVLYAGMLILVWLPLKFGDAGLYMLFGILYLIRLGFGAFALWWTPRAAAAMKRRVETKDVSVNVKL